MTVVEGSPLVVCVVTFACLGMAMFKPEWL